MGKKTRVWWLTVDAEDAGRERWKRCGCGSNNNEKTKKGGGVNRWKDEWTEGKGVGVVGGEQAENMESADGLPVSMATLGLSHPLSFSGVSLSLFLHTWFFFICLVLLGL